MVSASHDQTLRVWTFEGECIAELNGHTALVYSTACSDDGSLIASASEDNTVRTWRPDGQCLQTLEHPGLLNSAYCTFCNHACGLVITGTTGLLVSSKHCNSMWPPIAPHGRGMLVTLECSTQCHNKWVSQLVLLCSLCVGRGLAGKR